MAAARPLARVSALLGAHKDTALLDAAHRVDLGERLGNAQAVSSDEEARLLAWRSGMLRFDDAPLADIVRETERYTNVRFEIADDDLKSLRLGASYPAADAAGFVHVLEFGLPIRAVWLSAGAPRTRALAPRPQKGDVHQDVFCSREADISALPLGV